MDESTSRSNFFHQNDREWPRIEPSRLH